MKIDDLCPEVSPEIAIQVVRLARMNRPEIAYPLCEPEAIDLFEWLRSVDQDVRIEV